MMIDRTAAKTPRRKKAHPAKNARILSTGAAASLTFGVIAALAVNDAAAQADNVPQASQAEAQAPVSDGSATLVEQVGVPDTTVAPRLVIIRRIHILPATTVPAPTVPVTMLEAAPAVFDPQPAARIAPSTPAGAAKVSTAKSGVAKRSAAKIKKKVVAKPKPKKKAVVAKRKTVVRKAKPATRAS